VPAKNILISATHAHTCAALTPAFQSDPAPAYMAEAPGGIAQGLIQAHANLEPAEIAWNKASDPTQVFNRRWLMKPGQTDENPFDRTGDRARMNPGQQSHPVNPVSWQPPPKKSIFGPDSKNRGCFLGAPTPKQVLAPTGRNVSIS
jgi:hypothetical protein